MACWRWCSSLIGTLLALANESAFAMMHLSDLYAAASSAAQQEQLLAAGEAVIAANMWNSTAGFLAGIFMQGWFRLYLLRHAAQ